MYSFSSMQDVAIPIGFHFRSALSLLSCRSPKTWFVSGPRSGFISDFCSAAKVLNCQKNMQEVFNMSPDINVYRL